jgi:regulator of replication initiation timing
VRLVLLFVLIGFSLFVNAQSKKEQIEILNKRVDSLNNVLKNNSIHFIQKIDSIGNQQQKKLSDLDKKMTDLESNLERLKSENIEIIKQNSQLKLHNKHNDSLLSTLMNKSPKKPKDNAPADTINGFSIVRLKEKEINCSSKTKYHKSECSSMIFEYDWIQSYTDDEYVCSQANQVIEESIFGNKFAKDSTFNGFLEFDYEYFEHQHFFGHVNYISNDFISVTNYATISGEGILAVNGGIVDAFIFDIKRNEKINFSQIFKPNSEEKIRELILRHVNENERSRVNFGIDYIHYDRIILSNRGEKGICFFVGIEGLAVTTSPSRVCIPFEECTSLLNEEFQKRF